ncbi:hypothetical protein KP509_18G002400 [Ceratopteris richardii]|uniref:Uncharacterized protein n=1 Tax=Ceratopteris richardii TaxID=49495 RepID=A0A8T2SQB8_CERRI|nr:hypothetical protein KP509_18G002400 [Ceratopteris richardii]
MEVSAWLQLFADALGRGDIDAAVDMFDEEECYWRDLLDFTWNIETAESRSEIGVMLHATLQTTMPGNWRVTSNVERIRRPGCNEGLIQCLVYFETKYGRCKGVVRLRGAKCWTLLTALQELTEESEESTPRLEIVPEHALRKTCKTSLERRRQQIDALDISKQPYCLIVGGGHSGLGLGDSWRKRYKSLCLHTLSCSDHMPYMPYPENWPQFPSKDKIADWLEAYAKAMELVYWNSTECATTSLDETVQKWNVKVVMHDSGETVMLNPHHIVLATGISGQPNIPDLPRARDVFQGKQCHSSQFCDEEEWTGKHCVVIGSNNSAHNICSHLWKSRAASVTMVQRSPTHVLPSERSNFGTEALYMGKYNVRDPDLIRASNPYKSLPTTQTHLTRETAELYADLYKELEEVGFKHTFGEDGTGAVLLYLRRLLRKRQVKLKSGVEVVGLSERSVQLRDGTELDADLLVYATGYMPMQEQTARLISKEVADRVGRVWGLGSNTTRDPGPWVRELRNMWKPTPQPNLWFHGGGFQEARNYSLYLALQLKARMLNIPISIFRFPAGPWEEYGKLQGITDEADKIIITLMWDPFGFHLVVFEEINTVMSKRWRSLDLGDSFT